MLYRAAVETLKEEFAATRQQLLDQQAPQHSYSPSPQAPSLEPTMDFNSPSSCLSSPQQEHQPSHLSHPCNKFHFKSTQNGHPSITMIDTPVLSTSATEEMQVHNNTINSPPLPSIALSPNNPLHTFPKSLLSPPQPSSVSHDIPHILHSSHFSTLQQATHQQSQCLLPHSTVNPKENDQSTAGAIPCPPDGNSPNNPMSNQRILPSPCPHHMRAHSLPTTLPPHSSSSNATPQAQISSHQQSPPTTGPYGNHLTSKYSVSSGSVATSQTSRQFPDTQHSAATDHHHASQIHSSSPSFPSHGHLSFTRETASSSPYGHQTHTQVSFSPPQLHEHVQSSQSSSPAAAAADLHSQCQTLQLPTISFHSCDPVNQSVPQTQYSHSPSSSQYTVLLPSAGATTYTQPLTADLTCSNPTTSPQFPTSVHAHFTYSSPISSPAQIRRSVSTSAPSQSTKFFPTSSSLFRNSSLSSVSVPAELTTSILTCTSVPAQLTNPIPDSVSTQLTNPIPGSVPAQLTNPIPGFVPAQLTNPIPGSVSAQLTTHIPGSVPAELTNPIPGSVPAHLTNPISGPIPVQLTNPIPGSVPTNLTNPIPGSVSAQLTTHIPGSVPAELTNPIPGSVPAELTNPISGSVPAQLTNPVPGSVSAQLTTYIPGSVPADLNNLIPGSVPAELTNPVPGYVSAQLTNPTPDSVLAQLTNPIPGSVPAQLTNPISGSVSTQLTNSIPSSGPAQLTNHIPGSVPAQLTNPISGSVPAQLTNPISGSVPAELTNLIPGSVPAQLTNPIPGSVSTHPTPSSVPAQLINPFPGSVPAQSTNPIPGSVSAQLTNLFPGSVPAQLTNSIPGSVPTQLTTGCNPNLSSISAQLTNSNPSSSSQFTNSISPSTIPSTSSSQCISSPPYRLHKSTSQIQHYPQNNALYQDHPCSTSNFSYAGNGFHSTILSYTSLPPPSPTPTTSSPNQLLSQATGHVAVQQSPQSYPPQFVAQPPKSQAYSSTVDQHLSNSQYIFYPPYPSPHLSPSCSSPCQTTLTQQQPPPGHTLPNHLRPHPPVSPSYVVVHTTPNNICTAPPPSPPSHSPFSPPPPPQQRVYYGYAVNAPHTKSKKNFHHQSDAALDLASPRAKTAACMWQQLSDSDESQGHSWSQPSPPTPHKAGSTKRRRAKVAVVPTEQRQHHKPTEHLVVRRPQKSEKTKRNEKHEITYSMVLDADTEDPENIAYSDPELVHTTKDYIYYAPIEIQTRQHAPAAEEVAAKPDSLLYTTDRFTLSVNSQQSSSPCQTCNSTHKGRDNKIRRGEQQEDQEVYVQVNEDQELSLSEAQEIANKLKKQSERMHKTLTHKLAVHEKA